MAALAANPVVGRLTDNVGIAYGATIENGVGGSGSDRLIGNTAANTLIGNAGHDILEGRDGADILDGGLGNDVIDGGLGADRMTGGAGDDRYVVDGWQDSVKELAGGGTDTVWSADQLQPLHPSGEPAADWRRRDRHGQRRGQCHRGQRRLQPAERRGGERQPVRGRRQGHPAGRLRRRPAERRRGLRHPAGRFGNDVFVFDSGAFDDEDLSIDFIGDYARGDLFDFSALDGNGAVAGDQAFSLVSHLTASGGGAADGQQLFQPARRGRRPGRWSTWELYGWPGCSAGRRSSGATWTATPIPTSPCWSRAAGCRPAAGSSRAARSCPRRGR